MPTSELVEVCRGLYAPIATAAASSRWIPDVEICTWPHRVSVQVVVERVASARALSFPRVRAKRRRDAGAAVDGTGRPLFDHFPIKTTTTLLPPLYLRRRRTPHRQGQRSPSIDHLPLPSFINHVARTRQLRRKHVQRTHRIPTPPSKKVDNAHRDARAHHRTPRTCCACHECQRALRRPSHLDTPRSRHCVRRRCAVSPAACDDVRAGQ